MVSYIPQVEEIEEELPLWRELLEDLKHNPKCIVSIVLIAAALVSIGIFVPILAAAVGR